MSATRTVFLALVATLSVVSLPGAAVRGDGAGGVRSLDGIWSAAPEGLCPEVLNPQGDLWGDGPPHLEQGPDGTLWAVWSLAERRERDIAVSRYDGASWSPVERVTAWNGRADLDPRIGFLGDGTPVVVWWQRGCRQDRTPHVLLAVYRDGAWSEEMVSVPDQPAWRPGILVQGMDLVVAFDTPNGIVLEVRGFPARHEDPFGGGEGPSPLPGRVGDPGSGDDPSGGGSDRALPGF